MMTQEKNNIELNNDCKTDKVNLHYGSNDGEPEQNKRRGARKNKLDSNVSNLNNIYKVLFTGVFVFVFVLFTRTYVLSHVVVDGSSMCDTMYNDDNLFIEKVSYRFSKPDRYDIIVFRPYEDDSDCYYIKRVIALPGEKVQIINGKIWVNGELLDEDFGLDEYISNAGIAGSPIILGNDEYFVLGDNREVSLDSRDYRVGLISGNQIEGKAMIDFWPIKHFSILYNK